MAINLRSHQKNRRLKAGGHVYWESLLSIRGRQWHKATRICLERVRVLETGGKGVTQAGPVFSLKPICMSETEELRVLLSSTAKSIDHLTLRILGQKKNYNKLAHGTNVFQMTLLQI